ncbi:DUF1217 domain-containing protein [Tropicibacter naphthalenivorans]|uniref:Flagellar protein n=1 Tax=Tropicibacter naphthalenivorans TaxID=441103 RepID=A0A0N7LZQ6_9RHOB|nr:DUF1217 domain-containing protein [Tropicibacter naphthalenivorans]CUH78329.1 hypothetical protein TRN7648_01921 [Tropicibacter naphthalenivorans]SMC79596.1 Protein of unknown function [Tropicibacter naphthalenivorans]
MYTPIILGTGLTGYNYVARTRDEQQEVMQKSPQVNRDTTYFKEKMQTIQTSDELLDDRALLRVALGAFGLDEDVNNRAFLKKILDSDLTDRLSLANRLSDKRYLAFAKAFNFAGETAQTPDTRTGSEVAQALADVESADDLLNDPSLLRATLKNFGLEKDVGNTYFLKQVLESDVTDETSFANRLGDARYAELAEAFGFAQKVNRPDGIYGFAEIFEGRVEDFQTAEDLFDDPEAFAATLSIFGLEDDQYNIDFLTDVLNSDLGDPESVANQQDNPNYVAMTKLFGFFDRAEAVANDWTFDSKLQDYVDVMSTRMDEQIEQPKDLFNDVRLMLATFNLFDLPSRDDRVSFASRILESDRDVPTSLVNSITDPRYQAFYNAFDFTEPPQGRVYPEGFADAIVENYLDRQFEIAAGEADPTMRVALSIERDLSQLLSNSTANDSRWYGVMASKPLREVFETVFQLPSDSFGTLDVERQLEDLKARAERFFGTDKLADFANDDNLKELRRRYLVQKEALNFAPVSSTNVVLSLLSGASAGGGLLGS